MARIYLVRHGKAAASFTDDLDPGLDETGRQQALACCNVLQGKLPLALLSSPLLRAQETAAPLAEHTGLAVALESRVSEVPSPGLSLAERGGWLQKVMQGRWRDQSTELKQWRENIQTCLLSQTEDVAIFSHFVVINAAVGLAEKRDEVLLFRPDNGSISVFETDGRVLTLNRRGDEARTHVN